MSGPPDLVYGAINSALFGLNPASRESNYQIHPMIRNNWQSNDRLRDTFGYVPVIVSVNEGATNAVVENNKYAIGPSILTPFDPGDLNMTLSTPLLASDLADGDSDSFYSKYDLTIKFNQNDWNIYADNADLVSTDRRPAMTSLLNAETVALPYQGVPYFVRYFAPSNEDLRSGLLTTDPRMAGSDENVDPIMSEDQRVRVMSDHSFEYHMYDPSSQDSGYDIEINPVYNYFLDSDPDYESVIAPNVIPESLIPNYYMIEVCRNETPEPGFNWSGPYLAETSFDNSSQDWVSNFFQGIIPSSMPETQAMSRGYLQFYASTLETEIPDLAGGVAGMAATYNSKYKNIAVLTPEIQDGFLQDFNLIEIDDRGTSDTADDLLAITAYPYYNEIIIPHDNQHAGPASMSDFYDQLQVAGLSSDDAQKFLTLVQLYISYKYFNPSIRSFTTYDKGSSSPYDVVQESQGLRVPFNLVNFVEQLSDLSSDITTECRRLAEYYDRGSGTRQNFGAVGVAEPDFVPLRTKFATNYYFTIPTVDTNGDGILDAGATASGAGAFLNGSTLGALLTNVAAAIKNITRETDEFWQGVRGLGEGAYMTYAPSEPLMYVVEKRVVPAGQLVASPSSSPVQTLFFGKDYGNANKKGIRYLDTQIKYGVKYQYDIKQVRMVFGNNYKYSGVRSVINVPAFGRAFGNALGFFAPEDTSSRLPSAAPGGPAVSTTFFQIRDKSDGVADEGNKKYAPIPPNPSGIVDLPDHLRPTTTPSQFEWLPEDGELLPTAPSRGFYGYYIYLWNQPYEYSLYTNGDAHANGVHYGATGDTPLESVLDQFLNLDRIMIELKSGPGFAGNLDGGAIPGDTPDDGRIDLEPTESPGLGEKYGSEFSDIEEVLQSGDLALVESLNRIAETLGAQWTDQTQEWVQNGGPIADLNAIIAEILATRTHGDTGMDDPGQSLRSMGVMEGALMALGVDPPANYQSRGVDVTQNYGGN